MQTGETDIEHLELTFVSHPRNIRSGIKFLIFFDFIL